MVFGCNATNAPTDADESTQKKKLELIEGYVIVTTILIAFLVVFGSCRRRSHNKWLKIFDMYSLCFAYVPDNKEVEALTLASRSYGLVRNTKLIADFMAYEDTLSDEVDPVCMKGYKYLVKGEEKEKVTAIPPHYQNQLKLTREAITIDMIWECKGRLLSSTGDPDGQLKDICLSYALYRLLCRRFVGYPLELVQYIVLSFSNWAKKFIFDLVVQEARDVLNGCNSATNMMLFVTPSDDSTVHAEYLAKGGEFVTHLWALLSHAGILKRDSAHEDV
uniref:DUF4220 domain-containing protein n=1 Tax=Fagus sylvatica TaxID=28930 RepID=A0A2N9F3X4_FAGSY